MYSIGNLAKMSHITIRTLRYYDEIGLLKPTKVGDSGHRHYNDEALAKLHNIMMLKEMGFELETIHEIIENQVKSSKELLHIRLEIINKEQVELERMKKNIHETLLLMEMEGTSNWQAIFSTISKQYSRPKDFQRIWNNYFTKDEIEILKNLPTIDNEAINQWVELLRDIRKNMDKDPGSPIVQQLGMRWMDLVNDMYKGNGQLAQKTWNISKKYDIGSYDMDPAIVKFIDAALAYYYNTNKQVSSHE